MTGQLVMPKWGWAIFGERPAANELLASLAAGLLGAMAWYASVQPPLSWRGVAAALVVADVVAGCVSNFTRSTQGYYGSRPGLRWVFIAVHVHIVAFALLLNEPLRPALAVWLTTMVGAIIANRFRDSVVVGGAVLVTGLFVLSSLELPTAMAAVSFLYFVKVAFAFSTRHHPIS